MNFVRIVAAGLLAAASVGTQDAPRRTAPYPQGLVGALARLPVQEGGRIKPFDSVARVLLLRIAERRSVRVPGEARFGPLAGTRLGPTRWAMDVTLYPEQADDYAVFLIPDRDVLDLVGLGEIARGKRDRYSYAELRGGLERIEERARSYFHTEEKDRTRLQNQLVYLHQDLAGYADLRRAFDAARAAIPVDPRSEQLRTTFGPGTREVRFSAACRAARPLLEAYRAADQVQPGPEAEALDAFLSRLLELAQVSGALVWLPPADSREEAWLDFAGVFGQILTEGPDRYGPQLEAMAGLETVLDARGDLAAMEVAATAWVDHLHAMAGARDEAHKIDMEVAFYRHDHFFRAQWSFVLGFVLVLMSFLVPRSRLLYAGAWIPTAAATALVVWGVTERCILRGRPPVSTLYETILFVAGGIAVMSLVLEAIVAVLRVTAARRVALGVAALLGAFGMFLAGSHEAFKGEDTMPQLQAVLDTNFWLSTHVTTVTLGYMAGLLAGFVGHVYILGRLLGWKRGQPEEATFYRWIGRMIYASLCFALLLSTIGTILGGVWANDSWGRFWGWDPKENGALMIVLWNLLILHGRFGGFWRDRGIAVLAVLGNVIVAFSWWGVNLMGVGLHSYGFQSGLKIWVTAFYVSQVAVALLAWLAAILDEARQRRAGGAATPTGV